MQRIPIPIVAYSDIEVTLSGVRYLFTYRYNTRNERWKLDIKDSEENVVVNGLTLIEETSQTVHLQSINFPDGLLQVSRLNADDDLARRNNLGIDKNYELIYISYAELEE